MENNEVDRDYILDSLQCLLGDFFVGEVTKQENALNLLLLGGKQFIIKVEEVK